MERVKNDMKPIAFFGMVIALVYAGLADAGEWIDHTINSERLAGNLVGESPNQDIVVYLPDEYQQTQADFPVIYWFPGFNQVQTWSIERERVQDEFTSGRADPAVLVFMPIRTSFKSTTYLSSEAFGDWEGFLAHEVIPFIDNTYRTKATASQRGIMGFSLGGFASLTLPVLMPNTFGAVGANDPAASLISSMVRSVDEIPADVPLDDEFDINEFFDAFPSTVPGFADAETGDLQSLYGQVAARFSPNPDHPLLGDLPFDREGQWNPEARRLWREYDLLDPNSLALQRETLDEIKTVTVTLPQADADVGTPWTNELIRVYRDAGLPVQGIEVPGDHNDGQYDRFTMLLSNVSYALGEENRAAIDQPQYVQDFNGLGTDVVNGVGLPSGWSVSDHHGFVFRDRTNAAYRAGDVNLIGEGPYVLNAGEVDDQDRSLAVYASPESAGTTIQFLADVTSQTANVFELQFDVEITGDGAGLLAESDETLFELTAELTNAGGFQHVIELDPVTSQLLMQQPVGVDALTVSYASGTVAASMSDVESIRILWSTIPESSSSEWVFGLDNVQLVFDLMGDFDADSLLTANDIDLLNVAIRAGGVDNEFDLTGDGAVDRFDRDYWVRDLVGTEFGDVNLDKRIEFTDFLLFAGGFGKRGGWATGDVDGNGVTDFQDLLIFVNNYGRTSSVASVPEPASWILAFSFLAILGARRKV